MVNKLVGKAKLLAQPDHKLRLGLAKVMNREHASALSCLAPRGL